MGGRRWRRTMRMRTAAARNQTALAGDLKRVEPLEAFVAINGN
jgi:hypothetical protein